MGRFNLKNITSWHKGFLTALILVPLLAIGAGTRYTILDVDNIRLDGNTISTTNTNGNLTFDLNGTGSIILTDLTASTVPYLDSNKKIASSAVTPTELGYLSGVTSAIQTQLNTNKPMTTGGDMIYGGASGLPTRLPNGSAGQRLVSAGGTSAPVWTTTTPGSVQVLTSGTAATYTTPAGAKFLKVYAWGAGGSGGGCSSGVSSGGAGGGGGGGALAVKWIANPEASYTYTIGAGGTAGSSGTNPGNAGGTTTFGSVSLGTMSAGGGGAGVGGGNSAGPVFASTVGGAGGTYSGVYDWGRAGGRGNPGIVLGAGQAASGCGGNAPGVPSTLGIYQNTGASAAGAPGANVGEGGCGGLNQNNGGAQVGGAGFRGEIVVEEYYP